MRFVTCCLAVVLLSAAVPCAGEQSVWLDELDVGKTTCGYRKTLARRSVDGKPLRLRGKTYERGVGTHAPGQILVDLALNPGLARAVIARIRTFCLAYLERILDAARQLLVTRTTIESLSLREVARLADFTPGALYRYFKDQGILPRSCPKCNHLILPHY